MSRVTPALLTLGAAVVWSCASVHVRAAEKSAPSSTEKVSFYTQIRPIFQAQCQGCHQPARANGEYAMTTFDRLIKGGESGSAAVVPGKPDASYLLELITPAKDGKAEMPREKAPLAASDRELIQRWIAEGAVDDTPENARERFDAEHPPVYTRQPVISSLDYSPDGKLLAISGFHEVLIWKADGSERVARLIGVSERVETVRFSPDGKRLAVSGGSPARMGEVQVWDVATHKLLLSVPVTYDTVYGVNWSPDGTKISFGCADNTVRAIDAKTGEQILYQGAHNDWALDTVFSPDGSHLVSVGRDMSVKLTEVATQRFVDNVTSITPGALKGGVSAVARHPARDEIAIGGSDGVVKVYRMHRLTKRVIGDDANLIRKMPGMRGRIFGLAVSRDGKRIAAGSSLDGHGQVDIYGYEFDTALPDEIKRINEKVVTTRNPEEIKQLEAYHNKDVKRFATTDVPSSGVFAVAFQPDGKQVAAAGADGRVRLIDAATGKITREFAPAPITETKNAPSAAAVVTRPAAPQPTEELPANLKLASLSAEPKEIALSGRFDYAQLVVTGRLPTGETLDLTRAAKIVASAPIVEASAGGLVQPKADGTGSLKISAGGQTLAVAVTVSGQKSEQPVDYIDDVTPVLSRMGCTQGTCHGSAKGKNGFKLSLRGYDQIFDIRALTDDHASRRVNVASPDNSLMLLKATGGVPHMGGQLTRPGEAYYEIVRNWIASGATLSLKTPKVARIEIFPRDPAVPRIGDKQQVRIMATYTDGRTRDVTQEAFIESGNTEVATANRYGLMTAVRRGEAPILARYEGAYTATTLTIMGDRSGFAWQEPDKWGRVDELVAEKWQRMKILPSELCNDEEFVRRVHLDLTGLLPAADVVRAFVADPRASRVKRDELVDKLIGNPEFVEHWTNKWADLLQVNRKFLGTEGASAFRGWIRQQVAANKPYDQFVREILTADGSNRENPAASYYKVLREPTATMENTTHLFLAVRFNCNKCHDHPFERWTQDQYYQTSAYFAQVSLKRDPASGNGTIGGSAVEGAKPLYEIIEDAKSGDVVHERTGQVTPPVFPYPAQHETAKSGERRDELAAWITSADNQYFAKSYVNRLWGYLLGVGIMEPIDDIRAGNPPTNPALLDYLTKEFVAHNFDARHIMRLICKSRAYQLSVVPNRWNEDDKINYSHALARRLPAEVLYDAVYQATGATSKFPGVKPGTRAAELPDAGVELPSGFLATFGRPARESACECERSSGLQLGPVMALISGPTIAEAIADPGNELAKLVGKEKDDRKVIDELFVRFLGRNATKAEIDASIQEIAQLDADHQKLVAALAEREQHWAPIEKKMAKEREDAIAAAQKDLAAYEKEIAPAVAQREKEKEAKSAKLAEELKKYEATLPAKIAEIEKKIPATVEWATLRPQTAKANAGVNLVPQADRSVLVEGKGDKVVFTVTCESTLRNITALRLEAIANPNGTPRGPGLAGDNFVLNELEVEAAPKSDPKKIRKVELKNALADFAQEGYPIAAAADGNLEPRGGWAVSPATGITHWATFDLKTPLDVEGGVIFTFRFHHRFAQPNYLLRQFRLSVASSDKPVGLSLPEGLQSILATPVKERIQAQNDELLAYYRGVDAEWRKRNQELADSRKPLPVDPGLLQRRETLELANRPVQIDSQLRQLRQDVEMSTKLQANKRLTGIQDLAWVLINSPAFLFNH